jgi:hypothetical protein
VQSGNLAATCDAGICVSLTLSRVLVLLLAFRAVLAPLSYRPSSASESHRHNSLVMSIRWWPPQRLQRFSSNSKLLRLFRGKTEVVPDGESRLQHRARWSSILRVENLGARVRGLADALTGARLTTFLRC